MATVTELKVAIGADFSKLDSALRGINRRVAGALGAGAGAAAGPLAALSDIGQKMTDVGKKMTATVTAPLAGIGIASAKMAADFDQAMRNVNSIAQLNEEQFGKLRKAVMDVTADPEIRQGPRDLATALYDVYSSGFEGQKALDVLNVSARGASAGMTNTATASRALMAVLNSGIPGVKTAQQGMDTLFKIVDRGVVSFPELAAGIGQVLPIAAKAGVSLQEVGAFIAVATKQGQSGSEAINDLNNLLTKIIRPSAQAAKLMDELGISYGLSALQGKGLAGILAEITEKTKGNQDILAKLFPDMQAFRGLLAAGAQGGKAYRMELAEMQKASEGVGATQRALTQQNLGANAQWELLKKQLETVSIQIGDILMPHLRTLVGWLGQVADWFKTLSPATQQWLVVAGGIAAAIGPVLMVLGGLAKGIGFVVAAFKAVVAVVAAVSAVIGAPLVAIIAGVTAAVAALYLAWRNNWFGIRDVVAKAVTALKGFFGGFFDLGKQLVQGFINGIASMVGTVVDGVKNLGRSAIQAFRSLLGIASPSKVFHEIGQDTARGYVNGINSMQGSVRGAVNAMIAAREELSARAQFAGAVLAAASSRDRELERGHAASGGGVVSMLRRAREESLRDAIMSGGVSEVAVGGRTLSVEQFRQPPSVQVTQNIYGDVNNEADERRVTRRITEAVERTLAFST